MCTPSVSPGIGLPNMPQGHPQGASVGGRGGAGGGLHRRLGIKRSQSASKPRSKRAPRDVASPTYAHRRYRPALGCPICPRAAHKVRVRDAIRLTPILPFNSRAAKLQVSGGTCRCRPGLQQTGTKVAADNREEVCALGGQRASQRAGASSGCAN